MARFAKIVSDGIQKVCFVDDPRVAKNFRAHPVQIMFTWRIGLIIGNNSAVAKMMVIKHGSRIQEWRGAFW